jgi:hypothetical protein
MKNNFSVIFLDIDGVLNYRNEEIRRHNKLLKKYGTDDNIPWHEQILLDNPSSRAIKNLNWIIHETGAHVVISSTWRNEASNLMWNKFFAMCGFYGRVIGITKNLQTKRGIEIDTWIRDYSKIPCNNHSYYGELKSFVILDDDYDPEIDYIAERWVICNNLIGLTIKEADKAIKILDKKYVR